MFSFQKLKVWQKSIELLMEIDEVLKHKRMKGEYGLKDQLKRAGLSVPTNIAEGVGRNKIKEKRQFLNIAKGSIYETVSLIIVMERKEYISQKTYLKIYKQCDEIAAMLHGMIKSDKFHGI